MPAPDDVDPIQDAKHARESAAIPPRPPGVADLHRRWMHARLAREQADRERQRQKRLARLAAGTCVQCDSPPLPGKTRCERHHAMQKRAWAESNVAKLAKRKADAARRKAKPPL